MGNVVGGYYLHQIRRDRAERNVPRTGDPAFFANKIITARFYAEHVLPACGGLAITVMEGASTILSAPEEMF